MNYFVLIFITIKTPTTVRGKSIEADDYVLDSSEDSYTKDVLETTNAIINIVAKEIFSDAIRCLAHFRKEATLCSLDDGEATNTYIK